MTSAAAAPLGVCCIIGSPRALFEWAKMKLDCVLVYSHDGNGRGNIKNECEKMREAGEIGVLLVSLFNIGSK